MEIEYFTLKKDYWIARWLKKPPNKQKIKSEKYINSLNIDIVIGISNQLVDAVVKSFQYHKYHNLMFGTHFLDINCISTKFHISKAMVALILESKGLYDSRKVKK